MNDSLPQLQPLDSPQPRQRITVRALLLGDRIDTTGLERSDMISSAPFAFRIAENGFVALFRYGVIVLGGLSPIEEDDLLRKLTPRIVAPLPRHRRRDRGHGDLRRKGGPGAAGRPDPRSLAPERMLVVADALAKSVALAHNERR